MERKRGEPVDFLFGIPEGELRNIKFFRGSRDLISPEEFRRQIHSALMQKKLRRVEIGETPPKSSQPAIDVKEFVATI